MRIDIEIKGNAPVLQRIREGLADRSELHARLATQAEGFTKKFVTGLDQHNTARRLGANPTNHLAKVAVRIESASDEQAAVLRFPRASRLRAAFGTFTIRPRNGKKYLTIPDHASTYGKRVGEIAEPLHFRIVGGRFKALCFKDGTVAYWLREEVTIQEDRSLLPFKQLPLVARRVADIYLGEFVTGGKPA